MEEVQPLTRHRRLDRDSLTKADSQPCHSPTEKIHDPLPTGSSIRLLQLQPGNYDDRIKCRLVISSLDDKPEYEAISYVWGSEIDKVPILCNGKELEITQNLAAAFRHFRTEDTERTLWADSVCIDQRNLSEQGHQVKIMGDVYSNASRVLIWLGECDEDEIRNIQDCISRLMNWDSPLHGIKDTGRCLLQLGYPATKNSFLAYFYLLSRPYFSRAWTFQEGFVSKSRQVCFGTEQMSDVLFKDATTRLQLLSVILPECDLSLWMRQLAPMLASGSDCNFDTYYNTFHFVQLLTGRRGSGCKRPSDLIYSLLGVTRGLVNMEPDYSRPFEVVFSEYVFRIIIATESLMILVDAEGDTPSTLPTWVLDWRDTGPFRSFRGHLLNNGCKYFACAGTSKPAATLSTDGIELSLEGVRLDTVLAHSADELIEKEESISFLRPYFDEAPKHRTPLKETLYELWVRLMFMDVADFEEPFHRWRGRVDHDRYAEFRKGRVDMDDGATEKGTRIGRNMIQRCLIVTHKHYFGVAPVATQVGDVVAVLLGWRTPFVLRPQADGKYTFVGACYIDGMMDGQALIEARRKAEPDHDHTDTSWLQQLHEERLPFETETFTLK